MFDQSLHHPLWPRVSAWESTLFAHLHQALTRPLRGLRGDHLEHLGEHLARVLYHRLHARLPTTAAFLLFPLKLFHARLACRRQVADVLDLPRGSRHNRPPARIAIAADSVPFLAIGACSDLIGHFFIFFAVLRSGAYTPLRPPAGLGPVRY